MISFAIFCAVVCVLLSILWCFLWFAFKLQNGSRQRQMKKDMRIYQAHQMFNQRESDDEWHARRDRKMRSRARWN
jgi:hypothetical protein